jgi:uncharacterized protein YaeQ
MAISATICKAELGISDMDRHYYETFDLTLAKHPSETDLRMMVRLVAFALNADERLAFTKGITQEDEPDLWRKDLGGDIELWIDLGQPDEKRIRKACGRAKEVIIYTYHEGSARAWWQQQENRLRRFKNLRVVHLGVEGIDALAQRTMTLQCNIHDAELTLHDSEGNSVTVTQEVWK